MSDHNALIYDIGDEVVVKMDPEARCWEKGPPDGTRGYVVGYAHMIEYRSRYGIDLYSRDPGIYETRCGILVQWEGEKSSENGGWHTKPVDQEKYRQRVKERVFHPRDMSQKDYVKRNDLFLNTQRLGDLPEVEFWEGDVLRLDRFEEQGIVYKIDYRYLYEWTNTTPPKPMREHALYSVTLYDPNQNHMGGSTSCGTKTSTLISRGPLWHEYHPDEPPYAFKDLQERAIFEKQMMRYDEVRNARNGLYVWTLEESLDAIQSGFADGLSMSHNFFDPTGIKNPRPLLLHNRKIGEQVRQATLKGFNRL